MKVSKMREIRNLVQCGVLTVDEARAMLFAPPDPPPPTVAQFERRSLPDSVHEALVARHYSLGYLSPGEVVKDKAIMRELRDEMNTKGPKPEAALGRLLGKDGRWERRKGRQLGSKWQLVASMTVEEGGDYLVELTSNAQRSHQDAQEGGCSEKENQGAGGMLRLRP
jgi:hypothetical protein